MSSSVVVCTWGDAGVTGGVEEALTLGRKAAGATSAELKLLVLGPLGDSVAAGQGVRRGRSSGFERMAV